MEAYIIPAVLTAVFGLINWLLASKDARQQAEIAELKERYEKEVHELFSLLHKQKDALAAFQLKIAENHYPKQELDERFKQLNDSINKGFGTLSDDIKEMTKALNAHIMDFHGKGGQ